MSNIHLWRRALRFCTLAISSQKNLAVCILAAVCLSVTPLHANSGIQLEADRADLINYAHDGSNGFGASTGISSPALLSSATLAATRNAYERYLQLAQSGNWAVVPALEPLRVGMQHSAVLKLRHRLFAEGDLSDVGHESDLFDAELESAVKRFQRRYGLIATGIVEGDTADAMNAPIDVRLRQLAINYQRLKILMEQSTTRFVTVNIAGAEIEGVENGLAVTRHVAIVGRPDRPSPLLSSEAVEINFHPSWRVPQSVVRKDMIPAMRKDDSYVSQLDLRIHDGATYGDGNEVSPQSINWQTEEATEHFFTQPPGPTNALGSARINMPNEHYVYMHDTPQKDLFERNDRYLSSGCVRIKNVGEFLTWLLKETPRWGYEQVFETLQSGEERTVQLTDPVPVHWIYITAWATTDGTVHFRPDMYALDDAD